MVCCPPLLDAAGVRSAGPDYYLADPLLSLKPSRTLSCLLISAAFIAFKAADKENFSPHSIAEGADNHRCRCCHLIGCCRGPASWLWAEPLQHPVGGASLIQHPVGGASLEAAEAPPTEEALDYPPPRASALMCDFQSGGGDAMNES